MSGGFKKELAGASVQVQPAVEISMLFTRQILTEREACIQQAKSPNRYNKGYIENTRSTNCFASRIIWLCRGEEITKGQMDSLSALAQQENLVNLHHKKGFVLL